MQERAGGWSSFSEVTGGGWTVEWSLLLGPFGRRPWVWLPGFLIGKPWTETAHGTSTKCHRYVKWNHWGQTQKANQQILLSEALCWLVWFPFVPVWLNNSFFLLLGTSLFGLRDFPLGGTAALPRTCPRELRTEATAFPLEPKESSWPITLQTLYGKFGLWASLQILNL